MGSSDTEDHARGGGRHAGEYGAPVTSHRTRPMRRALLDFVASSLLAALAMAQQTGVARGGQLPGPLPLFPPANSSSPGRSRSFPSRSSTTTRATRALPVARPGIRFRSRRKPRRSGSKEGWPEAIPAPRGTGTCSSSTGIIGSSTSFTRSAGARSALAGRRDPGRSSRSTRTRAGRRGGRARTRRGSRSSLGWFGTTRCSAPIRSAMRFA